MRAGRRGTGMNDKKTKEADGRESVSMLPGVTVGVMIAVIAGNNPKYVPIAALFLAYVNVGAETMARMSDVPPEVVSIVQSVIIMFVVAEKFLANWKHKVIAKQSLKELGRVEAK